MVTFFTPTSIPPVGLDICRATMRATTDKSGRCCATCFRRADATARAAGPLRIQSLPSLTLSLPSFVMGAGAVLHFCIPHSFRRFSSALLPVHRVTLSTYLASCTPLKQSCSSSRVPSTRPSSTAAQGPTHRKSSTRTTARTCFNPW